jgi:XRE family transcriptional regulator, regulator of sulfur utilization
MQYAVRRNLLAALSATALLATAATAAEPATLSANKVIPFSTMEIRKLDNGGEQRRVLNGLLTTGEMLEVHETVLPVGATPHPPHKHVPSEIVFMQTGQVEFIDDDGKIIPAGPGDVIFTASNRMHGLKNVGTVPATYIVVEVGRHAPEH